LVSLFELYDDARTCQRQILSEYFGLPLSVLFYRRHIFFHSRITDAIQFYKLLNNIINP